MPTQSEDAEPLGVASLVVCYGKLVNADKEITQKLKLAGEQLEIRVLDHIIITEKGYLSFQDEGIF